MVMSINIREATLEAITNTIASMEKDRNPDIDNLKKLRKERSKLLNEFKL